ncbi:WG repeat-containing protein [Hymenobacter wooponensis]|uniref:NERD domain-containing protein n=1 Tax=Hymenobacter wooponensis TaxID=1525360 RepID=A0A4Z0MIG8_9BACT|nr:WG repeat-containing protein [Hymenobacter wooponensis]TGD78975.1 hypothetical protein EU557_18560 [Hymenobacter wooponensis]
MLHNFLFSPFSDAGQGQLYEQVRDILRAEASTGTTLLLGNFAVEEEGVALDAVIVRPHSITLLVLVPRGGQLQVPALSYGAWQLDGKPLAGTLATADNPYEQFRRQKAALAAWLSSQFAPEQANLQFITGLVVFAAPVTFGSSVEEQLTQQPDGSFHLLGNLQQLSRRLVQLARPEIDFSEADLAEWARTLAAPEQEAEISSAEPFYSEAEEPVATLPAERSFLRRAWGWLGAEDVPEDVPYGGQPAARAAASTAEKQRLEQMQREAQAQVQQQLQALEAREAERERRIEELRNQLAQAPPVTTEAQELQERLATESQEKAALEAAIQASRAESEARNRDLDAKIMQLGQLIEQLNTRTAATAGPLQATPAARGGSQLPKQRQRLLRTAAVVGGVTLLGAGVWGLSRLGGTSAATAPVSTATAGSGSATEHTRPAAESVTTDPAPANDSDAPSVEEAYEARYPYVDGYARVRMKGGAYTFIDQNGHPFSATYLEARDFLEGYAAVRDQRGWQYITGPEPEDPATPPFLFLEAYSFRDGLARVRLEPGYTYITKRNLAGQGPSVFQLYEAATDFENGRAEVTLRGDRFIIDSTGQPVE